MISSHYRDDLVTIYLADCRDVLLELNPDDFGALVTDPPYGMVYIPNSSSRRGRGRADWSSRWAGVAIEGDENTRLRDEILAWWGDRPAMVFGTWKQPRPTNLRTVLIWDKVVSTGMGDLDLPWRPSHEEIYVLGEGFTGKRSHGVLPVSLPTLHEDRKFHPTPKPVRLLEKLIAKCPPGVILDPFMGAGPTIIAARNLGRRVVGIEKHGPYVDRAIARLAPEHRLAFPPDEGLVQASLELGRET